MAAPQILTRAPVDWTFNCNATYPVAYDIDGCPYTATTPPYIDELVASVAILLVALGLVTWVAGRIFRTGILMHGKRPSPKEIWRWIRTA